MRVAALYDVHAMPVALEAVLSELGGFDAIVFGGDIFMGPLPQETLELDGVLYCHATPQDDMPIFDLERAVADIRASGWPQADEFVTENLLVAPSRAAATEHFEALV